MHPKRVEQLAKRIRENRGILSDRPKGIEHLEAAHTKLVELQAVRQHLKAKLARCIEQRDNALREVDQLRAKLSKYNTLGTD